MSDPASVLRAVCLEATGAAYGDPEHREAVGAEFDRHIARVKAEAWDEGHARGWSDAQDAHDVRQVMDRSDWPQRTPNPYREEGERDE